MTKHKVNSAQGKIYLSTLCALALNLSASDLGKIEVESSTIDSKFETTKTEVSTVATINREEVEEINPRTISDLLNTVAGVSVSNVGTDAAKIHIRGIDNQMYMGEKPGVAVVIDGVPVQETSGKINVDLDNIESIKVIKGGASYLYGNDALSGAIIITTKKPKGKSASKVEVEGGSFVSKKAIATTNQGFENSALQLQASYRSSDGYWDDAYARIKSVNGKYIYYINDTSDIAFGLDYTQRSTGDSNSVSGTIEAQENPRSYGVYSYSGYYDTDLLKGFVTYSNKIDEKSSFMLNIHKYIDDKKYKTGRKSTDKNEIWDQNGAKGEYRTAISSLAIMGGFDIQKNTTDETAHTIETGALKSDYKTDELVKALYTEVKYQATKDLVATLNFRYDSIEHKYSDKMDTSKDITPSYNVPSYRLGLNYDITSKLAIYSSISTGFRTPSVTQTSTNVEGLKNDPALNVPSEIGVETTTNFEIGVRGKISDLTYNASIYQLDRNNYIGRIAGSYVTSDDENESYYDNVGDMRSRGFELALNSDRREQLSFDLAYTYLEAIFTNYTLSQQLTENTARYGKPSNAEFQKVDLSGNSVPRTPNHTVDFTLHYKPSEKALISTEILLKSSYYADEVNAHKQAGYGVVNLRGEYSFTDALELFGRIDNLLNNNYYQFVNINSSALASMESDATIRVAPPRSGYVGLRYKF